MARLSLFVALALLSLVTISHESSAASVSSSSAKRSLKILLRQPTTPATTASAASAPTNAGPAANFVNNAANAVTAAIKGIFTSVAAQLKPVLEGLKLGKPDNKPKGDKSLNAQLAATAATKGLDKDNAKGTQYWTAIAAKASAAGGEAAAYVQNALNNIKAGGPKAGTEKASPTIASAPGGKPSKAVPTATPSAPGAPAAPGAPTTSTSTRGPAAPSLSAAPTASVAPSARAAPNSRGNSPVALVEENAEQGGFTDYHVVFRAFIPGAGTKAIAGVNTKSMTVGLAAAFPGYRAGPATHSFAGYVIGIYETDEIFNTNHRDWSTDVKGNDESKTFVYLQLNKQGGAWKKKSVTNGSTRTEHYCNGIWASWLQFWPTGLCCNDKATWEAEEGFSDFKSAGDKVSFKIKVRKGNPCVPGSYYAGPIMHSFDVEIDFAAKTFTYSGLKSPFPALEVCHGTKPTGFYCHVYGVAGKSVFDLMGSQQTVAKQTMELFESA